MLVLTRRLGESIVINNAIVLTVTAFNEFEAHVLLSSTGGETLRSLAIPKDGESSEVMPGVRVVHVRTYPDKIRVGIDYPRDMPIHRLENVDALAHSESGSIPPNFPKAPPMSPIRRLPPYPLWIGHAGHVRNLRTVLDVGITALVDLALNEPVPQIPRDLIYCRFPLIDGVGNEPRLLRAAVHITADLLRLMVPTLIFCSAGSSRSPVISAAAISVVSRRSPTVCLAEVARSIPHDVSPGLWADVVAVLD